jgi:hypothetical protein
MGDLEREISTEEEYDNFILDKINSSTEIEGFPFFEDFVQKERLKKEGINLEFYREGDRIYYAFKLNPNS